MTTALLVARLILAIVLALAGVAKLADLPGSRQAMRDFGLAAGIATVAGTALPLLELLVAAALLVPGSARWAALAALVMFVAFSAAIGAALRRGEQPDCHCFGQLHSAPVGRATLARNLALAAIAGFVLAAGSGDAGGSATAWVAQLDTTQAIGLGVAAALTLALVALARLHVGVLAQNGRLLARVERLEQASGARVAPGGAGLPVGATAPLFDLPAAAGGRMSLEHLQQRGKPVLLVFSDAGCGACRALAPDLATWHREHHDRLTVAVLARGTELGDELGDDGPVALLQAAALASAYGVSGTPSAVLVGSDGRVASRLASGTTGVRTLLKDALELPAAPPTVIQVRHAGRDVAARPAAAAVGEPVPVPSLAGLDGDPVALRDPRRERATLLLFWNPGCGFCQRMLEDVRAFDAEPPPGAPRLVVVTGAADAGLDGLHAPVVVDGPGRPALVAFGASATPSAVLIDAAGAIASPVVVGAQAVLTLADARADLVAR